MKKIVLGLSALVATYFGVCVSQCDVNAQVSAQPIVKLVESDAFRRVELQHLPYDVLKTMGTSEAYEGCTFEGAYVKGTECAPLYKILVQKEDRTQMYVFMNREGEIME
ncbi:hypothetical protein [Parabacteroides johnsonii]|jgi:hypothetical protein|uniref:hypothetical protein n=1 Tax=Parabacteroides johnsonii TaxID=387661 RepID=UPI001898D765|nr:hypothetical protein [Parabacteroides johnsonii]